MRVLVTGGAGYIGSHTVVALSAAGHNVVIVDNFVNSSPAVIPRLEALTLKNLEFVELDLTDFGATEELFAGQSFDAVIHFAGLKAVGESVAEPLRYYRNNLDSTLSVVSAMIARGVNKIVFSSSATVYGDHAEVPYREDAGTILESSNPYGQTKVMIERILKDVAAATPDFKAANLRYFNPIGAHASGTIGENPSGIPNNLMPYIAQVAVGRREALTVHGGDYPTIDGTGERDYLHVMDLAEAHVAALEHLDSQVEPARAYNLGTGMPTSVLELLRAFEQASGEKIPYVVGPRRAGDLAVTFADPTRATHELGWEAKRTIGEMAEDTWRWQAANPEGYESILSD